LGGAVGIVVVFPLHPLTFLPNAQRVRAGRACVCAPAQAGGQTRCRPFTGLPTHTPAVL
jgi:hypothetical protein